MRNLDILGCTTISVLLSEGSSQSFHSLASLLYVFQGRGKSKCFIGLNLIPALGWLAKVNNRKKNNNKTTTVAEEI